MIIYGNLKYSRLMGEDGFDLSVAMREAREGFVTVNNAHWQTAARLRILKLMTDEILTSYIARFQLPIKSVLLQGAHPTNAECVNLAGVIESEERGRSAESLGAGPTGRTERAHMGSALSYLAYSFSGGGNYSSYVTQYLDNLEADRLNAQQIANGLFTCVGCNGAGAAGRRVNVSLDGMVPNTNGRRRICPDCQTDYVFSSHQGVWMHEGDDMVYPDWLDGPVSRRYADSNYFVRTDEDGNEEWFERDPGDRILGYSANPFDYNAWDPRNPKNALVFGVELEMEPRSGSETGQRNLIRTLGGNVRGHGYILKHDGSLRNGVEMVSMPYTLEQHKDGSAVDWAGILSRVNKGQAMSGHGTDRCGMHIHINKAALSALTIGKMLVFLNSATLSSLISTIAQRGSGHYCERDQNGKKVTDGAFSSGSRYDIMNVSVSHPTCEVRMFRGNLRPERVYKNLEFCHALVQYCRFTSIGMLEDWGNFSRWLISNRGQYPHLVQFLIDKRAVGFRQHIREDNEHYCQPKVEEV